MSVMGELCVVALCVGTNLVHSVAVEFVAFLQTAHSILGGSAVCSPLLKSTNEGMSV